MTPPRKPTKFLDATEIDRGILEMARLASKQGVRVALLGGAALQLYGSERLTKDVDLAAGSVIDGVEIKGPLSFGGVAVVTTSGVPVDLIIRDDEYSDLYEAALEAALPFEGVPVPVISAEHILAMKLVADRTKDLADLEFLVLDSNLNYAKARGIVKQYLGRYAADELDRYRDSITWERSRKR